MRETAILNRYELSWNCFVKELDFNSKITLHSVCKTMHTDYDSMKKWVYRIGHSVTKEKATHSNKESEHISSSAFAVIVPNDNTSVHTDSPLLGVSITFDNCIAINKISLKSRKNMRWCVFAHFID